MKSLNPNVNQSLGRPERRTLLDEFLVRLDVFPDHLEVDIRGAGKLNVALHEAGLQNRSDEITRVGGPT